MHHHAPPGYECPFCLLIQGIKSERVLSTPNDIVWQDDKVLAFIGTRQWPRNSGHVIIVPKAHFENLYDLPLELGTAIHRAAKKVAFAMKRAYGCAGISTRQHNEPAGNQDVWHYHLHVFPRYAGDNLYQLDGVLMPAPERVRYAARLRGEIALTIDE